MPIYEEYERNPMRPDDYYTNLEHYVTVKLPNPEYLGQTHMSINFYKKEPKKEVHPVPHNTDGPAVITWDPLKDGVTKMYYLEGLRCNEDTYLKVLNAPFDQLPLYLNQYPYSLIAQDRLKGDKTEIVLKKSIALEYEIHRRIDPPTQQQVLIKNLVRGLRRAINKSILDFKPLKA